jgi:uncharacterized protein (TIGR00255 family)
MQQPPASATALRSMTGCGVGTAADGASSCRVELRVVNNRFFKFTFHTQAGGAGLEGRAEAAVRQRVRRGTVQMQLELTGPIAPAGRRLDTAQLEAYLDDLERFCAGHDLPAPRAIDGLLGLPGLVLDAVPAAGAADEAWPLVSRALAAALDGLDAMRRTEAEALARELRGMLGEVRRIASSIAARVPAMLDDHRRRLAERVAKLLAAEGVSVAAADVAREVALLADRTDVAEELARLESHVAQFDRLLDTEAAGRTLDFLSQELAREANTIGSKALDAETAHAVVELKTWIERAREQVQNIE